MPRINTRYASGPLDEVVYGAAEAAGMPLSVISGYDGVGFAWRWRMGDAERAELRDVVFRIRPSPADVFTAEVAVEGSSHSPVPKPSTWSSVARKDLPSPAALDESWLTTELRAAAERAARPH